MSYARFSEVSDVYVFSHVDGYVKCCECLFHEECNFHSADEIVEHLRKHVKSGHKVPASLLNVKLYEDETFVLYEPN